jgi:predicted nucleic acid-binding protein
VIAADTSSLIAFFDGQAGPDVTAIGDALQAWQLVLPPVVLTEMLSDPRASVALASHLAQVPLLELGPAFWRRAGELRSKVLARGHKSRVADALIAQICIDHGVPLITRDRDFRHYVRVGGLRLAV